MRKKWEVVAISDTHLGEDSSLLSYPHGRQHLWNVLRKEMGCGEKFEIEELIFLGDLPDRTLSSTSQVITNTNDFLEMIFSVAQVKNFVYMPGNHDHTIWTEYIQKLYGKETKFKITKPAGEYIIKDGAELTEKIEAAADLVFMFFGKPGGSNWRNIQIINEQGSAPKVNFKVANPLYAKTINDRTFAFAHGTHFRGDVCSPQWIKKAADYSGLDYLIARINIQSKCDVSKAYDMEDLEARTAEFVDSLWPSPRNNPTSRSDSLWYFITQLGGKFKTEKRPAPNESKLYNWDAIKANGRDPAFQKMKSDKGAYERWNKYFRDHMIKYLKDCQFPTDKITFVFGDTHDGGWQETADGSCKDIRLINTGGWVCHEETTHPACFIFAVDEEGKENILDVSFSDASVEGEPLLKLATNEAEHKKNNANRALRAFLKAVELFQ